MQIIIDTAAIPDSHSDDARADWLKAETDAAWAFASTIRSVIEHACTHGVDPLATIRLVLVGPSAGDVPAMSGALVFGASKCLPLEFAELSAVGALRVSVPRETVQQAARHKGLEVSEHYFCIGSWLRARPGGNIQRHIWRNFTCRPCGK